MRRVVHDNVGVHAVPLDEPRALGSIDAEFRPPWAIPRLTKNVAGAQPDLAAPGSGANQLAKTQTAEAFGERLAVRRRELVDEHHDVTAEGGTACSRSGCPMRGCQ